MAHCGDGVIDRMYGEECDDGNTLDSDGCSAICTRESVCGDGILDAANGEACDDGNTAGGDGCSADCQSVGTWEITGSMGTARRHHAGTALLDGRVLVAGGYVAGEFSGTTPISSAEQYTP